MRHAIRLWNWWLEIRSLPPSRVFFWSVIKYFGTIDLCSYWDKKHLHCSVYRLVSYISIILFIAAGLCIYYEKDPLEILAIGIDNLASYEGTVIPDSFYNIAIERSRLGVDKEDLEKYISGDPGIYARLDLLLIKDFQYAGERMGLLFEIDNVLHF
ncbi:hypothetical protein C0584_05005 [Candidatus Parcubacteria bacterium]|nr:MAG: hypothetical protein C0584_05005 [Candidatus Parcubacteria bacterium]